MKAPWEPIRIQRMKREQEAFTDDIQNHGAKLTI